MSSFRIEMNKRSLGFPETVVLASAGKAKLTIEKDLEEEDFIGWIGDFTMTDYGITMHILATVGSAMHGTLLSGGPTVNVIFNAKDSGGVSNIQFLYNPANGRVLFGAPGSEDDTNWLFPEEEE